MHAMALPIKNENKRSQWQFISSGWTTVVLMKKGVYSAQIETSNTAPGLVGHDFLGDTGNTDS